MATIILDIVCIILSVIVIVIVLLVKNGRKEK